MFPGIKTEKFIESEHSGIFRVKLVTKNVVLGSSGIHFMHMMVKRLYMGTKNFATFYVEVCKADKFGRNG